MTAARLTRRFVLLRALRWLPVALVVPFLVIIPTERGLSLSAIGAVFAVHSAVAIVLEVPSGALADTVGRRRVLLGGALLTGASLAVFAVAEGIAAFMLSVGTLAAGRALISGALEAWYVDSLRALDPAAPLSAGLSRGTAAEALAMALGSLAAGGLVALAGYAAAALAGAGAALVYMAAIAVLVDDPPLAGAASPRDSIRRRFAAILATARAEAAASATVRVVIVTGVGLGTAFTAVELLWQPRLAELLGEDGPGAGGLVFGALAAAAMLAVALGAASSPRFAGRLGLRAAYLAALALGALAVACLGLPQSIVAFGAVYLVAYLGMGLAEPLHYELLNDAVGPTARATLISAESLAAQGGSLAANLGVGVLAATHGTGSAWALAGTLLLATTLAVAVPLTRAGRPRRPARAPAGR